MRISKLSRTSKTAVIFLVSLVIALGALLARGIAGTSTPVAHAEGSWGTSGQGTANDRIATFIALAKNKDKDNNGAVDLSKLDKADARALGVYLTNFLTPYMTEVGDPGKADGLTKDSVQKASDKSKENMKKALTENLQFSDSDSSAIVNWFFNEIRASAGGSGKLHWEFVKSDSDFSDHIKAQELGDQATYWQLMNFISGGMDVTVDGGYSGGIGNVDGCRANYDAEGNGNFSGAYGGAYKNCLTHQYDGKPVKPDEEAVIHKGHWYADLVDADGHPAFSLDLVAEHMTPSVAALMMSANAVDGSKGYGTSFFNLSGKQLSDLKDKAQISDSVFGEMLYWDAFGDLISGGRGHQYVLIPGAANPFVWSTVDGGTGDDKKDQPAGSVLFTQNVLAAYTSSSSEGINKGDKGQCLLDDAVKHVQGVKGSISEKDNKGYLYRDIRGSTSADFRQPFFFINNGTNAGAAGKAVLDAAADQKIDFNTVPARIRNNGFLDLNKGNFAVVPMPYFGLKSGNGGANLDIVQHDTPCAYSMIVVDPNKLVTGSSSSSSSASPSSSSSPSSSASPSSSSSSSSEPSASSSASESSAAPQVNWSTFDKKDLFSGSGIDSSLILKKDNSVSKLFSALGDEDASTLAYSGSADPSAIFDDNTAYSLYVTYLLAGGGGNGDPDGTVSGDSKTGTKGAQAYMGFRMNSKNMVAISNGKFEKTADEKKADEKSSQDDMTNDIRQYVWFLLNPTKGLNYFTTLVKNKTTALLISFHADMLGVSTAPVIAGTTRYIGFSGYVTVPELTDLAFTDSAYHYYNDNYMYVIMGIVILMGLYAVSGVITLQRAVAGALVFGALSYIPAMALNATINASNNVTNIIYGQKFTYWALTQNQAYSTAIDKAASGQDYQNYLAAELNGMSSIDITGTGTGNNNRGADSVVVKWQAPKKLRSLVLGTGPVDDAVKNSNSQLLNKSMAVLNNKVSGQSFNSSDSSVYLYRSYVDLDNFSKYIYNGINTGKQDYNKTPDTKNWPEGLKNSWDKMAKDTLNYQTSGFGVAKSGDIKGAASSTTQMHITPVVSSPIVSDTFSEAKNMNNTTLVDYKGIDSRAFNFGIPMFTQGIDIKSTLTNNATTYYNKDKTLAKPDGFDPGLGHNYSNKDYTGLAAYSLMSESPYYYYSWNMYDQGLKPDTGAKDGFKTLILGTDGKSYFYNTIGNQEMRDFLDMRSMFTYVIPYLKAGNDVVRAYDKTYGLKYNKGVPTVEGYEGDPAIANDPVMLRKYWQNLNVSRLYGIYSPWVDLMYDADYAKSVTLEYQGKKVTVPDPIDPASYPSDRPMVFSKSEQVAYGLKDDQLTQVEKKIQQVESGAQKSMFQLMNSYNYDDNVLNTAASMETTFEFNKTFSETRFVGENIQLYPQSFELKNFSYDAYLRLILSNSTSEPLNDSSGVDFYTRIVQNSSITTILAMLVLDVESVYIIPVFKIGLVCCIAILSLLKIYAAAFKIEEGREFWRTVLDAIVYPLLEMFAVFVGMAFVVSWFMSNGNTSVTGYDGTSISLGDPVMTILAMIMINTVVIMLLWKILTKSLRGLVLSLGQIAGSLVEVVKGTASTVAGFVSGRGAAAASAGAASAVGAPAGAGAGAAAGGGFALNGVEVGGGEGSIATSAEARVAGSTASVNIPPESSRGAAERGMGTGPRNRDMSSPNQSVREDPAKVEEERSRIDNLASGNFNGPGSPDSGASGNGRPPTDTGRAGSIENDLR